MKSICSIDLGSYKIKGCLATVNKRLEMVDITFKEIPSRGIKQGMIKNISELSESIALLMDCLQEKKKARIDKVYVGINGLCLNFCSVEAVIPLTERANKLVDKNDLERIEKYASNIHVKFNEELLHNLPQFYVLDDNRLIDPIGLYGHCLQMQAMFVLMKTSIMDSLIKAFSQSGVDVDEFVFSDYAASFSVLDKADKEKGCVLLDIGSELTHVIVFEEGRISAVRVLSVGSNSITEDIAKEINISFDLANDLKVSHGSVAKEVSESDKEILVKISSTYKKINKVNLNLVIGASTDRLLNEIKSSCVDIVDFPRINKVVAIGEGVLLDGFLEKIESLFGITVVLGQSKEKSSQIASKYPTFCICMGILRYSLNDYIENKKSFYERFSPVGIFNKLKLIYQEYF
ncbi:MAG: cell division protein FtsA [Candidatus Gygaella obscura]|nr:cell division protein FtsA [Candidatus Gygaella obscura]